jgi:hypothetical protein
MKSANGRTAKRAIDAALPIKAKVQVYYLLPAFAS